MVYIQIAFKKYKLNMSVWQMPWAKDHGLEFFKKALAIFEAKLGKEHPDTATTYNNIASVYQDMGQLDLALEFFKKALAIREATLGKEHPDTANSYNNIALVYQDMGRLNLALVFQKKVTIRLREGKKIRTGIKIRIISKKIRCSEMLHRIFYRY